VEGWRKRENDGGCDWKEEERRMEDVEGGRDEIKDVEGETG
jgi:hypothetical protein